MRYTYDQMAEDIKVIKAVWVQWYNGYHLSPSDRERFDKAMARVNKLQGVVNEPGVAS